MPLFPETAALSLCRKQAYSVLLCTVECLELDSLAHPIQTGLSVCLCYTPTMCCLPSLCQTQTHSERQQVVRSNLCMGSSPGCMHSIQLLDLPETSSAPL